VWRVGSGQPVSVLPAHENFVNDVEFSRDGSFVVTAGKDGTARTWRAENGESLTTLSGHGDSVVAASFLPDGRRVVTAGLDGTVRVWNAVRQPELRLVRRYDEPVGGVRFAGGRIEATVAGRVHVLDAQGRELGSRTSAPTPIERAPDGATLTITRKTVLVRRPTEGELVLIGHRDAVTSARFSPDGRLVVTASRDHDPIVWNARTGKVVRKLLGHFAIVSDAAFSPDGRWIVTAGPGKAGVWDASTGELEYFLQGHEGILLAAAFDPTSRVVVTGGKDGTVRTWRCAICARVDGLIRIGRARVAARNAPTR
jgi:WD40 repeat protein